MYENPLPLTGLSVINHPSKIKIQVEKRRVRLANTVIPAGENAWIYRKVSFPQPPGSGVRNNYLGPVINVRRGSPCQIDWINTLESMPMMPEMLDPPPINPKPMDPNMQPSTGIVTHLHGAKVPHDSDGWPLNPAGYAGNPYAFPTWQTCRYPNDQRAAMLWFHDHTMDNTAPQVYAGLAGVYFIRDTSDDAIFGLIGDPGNEIPLVIQDRNLACSYDALDYWSGIPTDVNNPDLAPDGYNRPEFLGETIFVNGRAAPFHNVNRSVYRLRILNGSNARTYALALIDPFWWAREASSSRLWFSNCMRVIGNDGGLFVKSAPVANNGYVLIAPGERLDILLDLTIPAIASTDCLRLVNLAVASAMADSGPEGIFQSDSLSVLKPASDTDPSLCNALKLGQANIMQFCLGSQPPEPALDVAVLDSILLSHADDEGFSVSGTVLGTVPAGTAIARNRFVLLMNNTGAPTTNPLTAWKDVQMWELGAPDGVAPTWDMPFAVDTAATNPAPGNPGASQSYGVFRATFFQAEPPPLITPGQGYPALHAPTFTPMAGTYERWYVANTGNAQPVTNDVVDMHPFHIHLVNFTVTRRWELDSSGSFVPKSPNPADFDGISRHDTVRIQSNELLELLVFFPPGYSGDYVYHCHLVEHEDMGMMLHFTVQP